MKKKLSVMVAVLCCLLFLTGIVMATDLSDPILKKLVEKGILTKEDAANVMKEIEKDNSKKAQKSDENIDKKASLPAFGRAFF